MAENGFEVIHECVLDLRHVDFSQKEHLSLIDHRCVDDHSTSLGARLGLVSNTALIRHAKAVSTRVAGIDSSTKCSMLSVSCVINGRVGCWYGLSRKLAMMPVYG